ncbi:MAG: hypothetical protein RLZ25_457 [Pseudomonadota bacterium]
MDSFLSQHPEIFMAPRKESHFFATDMPEAEHLRDSEAFNALFFGVRDEVRVGESSVWHLASKEAARNIHQFNPDAQIIVMLRNPMEMIPSLHSYLIFCGYENIRNLREALEVEPARRNGRLVPKNAPVPVQLQYRDAARYVSQLKRYIDVFGRDRIHVVLYDEFERDPDRVFRGITEFLGVESNFQPKFTRVNANKVVGSLLLRDLLKNPPSWVRRIVRWILPGDGFRHGLIRRLQRINVKVRPRNNFDSRLISELQAEFIDENRQLGTLIGRDLEEWNKPRA